MVEGAPLLREYRLKKLIEGSNPSLSATHQTKAVAVDGDQSRLRVNHPVVDRTVAIYYIYLVVPILSNQISVMLE